MTIKEILTIAIKKLNESNIEDASMLARMLLANVLKIKKEELIINLNEEINEKSNIEFFAGIEKISKGYPIQYITQKREFMQMDFFVDEKVLVPRPDTEILVEEVIKICKNNDKKDILELCTGSGAIRNITCKKFRQCKYYSIRYK